MEMSVKICDDKNKDHSEFKEFRYKSMYTDLRL